MEEILKATIDTAVAMKAIKPAEFERVIADTTVQPKAVAHPADGRLLEAARRALVKAAITVMHKSGLMVGARTFPGNPYDGHILAAQIEQVNILLEGSGGEVREVFADLGFRGVDQDTLGIQITHQGKFRSLTKQQRKWLRRLSAVEPAIIGHAKSDCRLDRCWLKGQIGDALHAVLCTAGYNIRWLLRASCPHGAQSPLFAPDSEHAFAVVAAK